MSIRQNRDRRAVPVILGAVTLAGVGVLLVWDIVPKLFPERAHNLLAALPLLMIACTYLIYQLAQRPPVTELVKAILLAAAFVFWAANQFWPALPQATLFNDIAIALFVLDVFLVVIGWPSPVPHDPFGDTNVEPGDSAPRP